MFINQIAYRHQNGEIQGFVGTGFTVQAAERDSRRRIEAKVGSLGQAFDPGRIISRREQVTTDEMKMIQDDWKLERGQGILR